MLHKLDLLLIDL